MEKDIETYVREKVERMGGKVLKWVCPGNKGVPDRIVLVPGGLICFAEFKDAGEKPRPLQKWWRKELRKLGFRAVIIEGMAEARLFVDILEEWMQ